MRLSPSGGKALYFTAAAASGTAVVVADLATGATRIVLSADKANIRPCNCNWKNEARIICRVYFITYAGSQEISGARAFSIAADGSSRIEPGARNTTETIQIDQRGARLIDFLPDDPDHVLMEMLIPEQSGSASNIQRRSGVSVQKVDVNNGRMTPTERPGSLVSSFDSDDHGEVRYRSIVTRLATGYVEDRVSHYVRARGSKTWVPAHEETISARSNWQYLGFDESGVAS